MISIVEVENVGMLTALRMPWDDLFDIEIFPAVTVEQGLALLREMAPA